MHEDASYIPQASCLAHPSCIVQVLLKAGADPTKAVHVAVAEGHDDMLQDLLDAGADVTVAFRLAVERQDLYLVKDLLRKGTVRNPAAGSGM
jgi:ankyrin repeat protein